MLSNQGQVFQFLSRHNWCWKGERKWLPKPMGSHTFKASLLKAVDRCLRCPSAFVTFSLCPVTQQDSRPLGKENSSPRQARNWHRLWSWYKHSKWLSTEQLCQIQVHVLWEHCRQNCVFSADGWGGQIPEMQVLEKLCNPSGQARRPSLHFCWPKGDQELSPPLASPHRGHVKEKHNPSLSRTATNLFHM